MQWGLLGPDKIVSQRRTRTLEVGASVRAFNDLAVPGTAGVSFCKQLFLACLGIVVAEKVREKGAIVSNIPVTNAIEALACWLDFNFNGTRGDRRLRGSTKLPERAKDELSFRIMRRSGTYVSQPMRMGTTQALPALGLVDTKSARFNSFRLTERAKALVDASCDGINPNHSTVVECLVRWVIGEALPVHSERMYQGLAPTTPLPRKARTTIGQCVLHGGQQERDKDTTRRKNAYAWIKRIERPGGAPSVDLDGEKPAQLENDHWTDLRAGARFFKAQDAAISLLDAVENHVSTLGTMRWEPTLPLPERIDDACSDLRDAADDYLELNHADLDARKFCEECRHTDPRAVIRALVRRDSRVLRLGETGVRPGPAFQPRAQDDNGPTEDEMAENHQSLWPGHISYRVPNLYLLHCDIEGRLDNELKGS